jgi:hypothetical protein
MTVRVGVTGHRRLADPHRARDRCVETLHQLRQPDSEIEIWSSLAEGADRLVAELVPSVADRLVAVLPLAPDEYRRDFATSGSLRQFDALMAVADDVEITGPDETGSRESAYERAGLVIVERCDVLLALWDGKPPRGQGGTADIVRVAREQGRTVIHIPVVRA